LADAFDDRRQKLDALRQQGIDPFPRQFEGRVEVATALPQVDAQPPVAVQVAGRVGARRDFGQLVFFDLVDATGRLQVMVKKDACGEADHRLVKKMVDEGDFLGVSGKLGRSKSGEPTVFAESVRLLTKSLRSPPEKWHGLTDIELRYRYRYLDLISNAEVRQGFVLRSRVIQEMRRLLTEKGFIEVETPMLHPIAGGAAARPFVTHHNSLDMRLYLRIAPELYLKRLIVGGLERVYEIGKDFRNEGVSYKHNPEFTMLEWYEAYADYRDTMARIEELVRTAAQETLGTTKVLFRGHEIDLGQEWRRVRFVESLEQRELWTRDEQELRAWLTERQVDTGQDKTWAQLVDHAFSHFVEPELIEPTIVHDYPVELSPFARTTDDDPALTERFEYFVGGMELGNAFSEINDAETQAERFAEQAELVGGEQGDPDYVEALAYGMPPTGGLGLGIDRLAMVLTGRETIRDVILYPMLRERA
jgi:lysyl-tRNA synthetase class 2